MQNSISSHNAKAATALMDAVMWVTDPIMRVTYEPGCDVHGVVALARTLLEAAGKNTRFAAATVRSARSFEERVPGTRVKTIHRLLYKEKDEVRVPFLRDSDVVLCMEGKLVPVDVEKDIRRHANGQSVILIAESGQAASSVHHMDQWKQPHIHLGSQESTFGARPMRLVDMPLSRQLHAERRLHREDLLNRHMAVLDTICRNRNVLALEQPEETENDIADLQNLDLVSVSHFEGAAQRNLRVTKEGRALLDRWYGLFAKVP